MSPMAVSAFIFGRSMHFTLSPNRRPVIISFVSNLIHSLPRPLVLAFQRASEPRLLLEPIRAISEDSPARPNPSATVLESMLAPGSERLDSMATIETLNYLDATLTKNTGGGVLSLKAHFPCFASFLIFCMLPYAGFAQTPPETPKPKPATSDVTSIPSAPHAATLEPQLANSRALLNDGRINEAETVVAAYLKTHPESAYGYYLRGYILFRQIQAQARNLENARYETYRDPIMPGEDFQDAAAKASLAEFTAGARYRVPDAFELKIVALDYILLNDYADADKWLTHSLRENPRDSEGWYWMGRTKYSENRYKEAVESFQQFLKLEPKNVKAEDNLGLAYAGLGQTEEAIAAYQTAIAWQADAPAKIPGPFLNLGILLMEQNRPAEALPNFVHAVAIAPNEWRSYEQLGQAYSRLEQPQRAQEELETAVRLSPQNPRLHYLLGRVYSKEGLTEKAKIEFSRSEALQAAQPSPSPSRP